MTNGAFFDQVSLAAIANLTAGMTATNGTFVELISSFLIVRVFLKFFYKTKTTANAELQIFIVSAISWIVGNSLLRGHSWQTQDLYLSPEIYEHDDVNKPKSRGFAFITGICLDLLRKAI